ncbi:MULTISPECIES: flagellar basal body-associated protein FliL [Dickeya]|uniref:Flagellar protein FliL n=1 Tax=Dickeya fangzhongdai TaxID=1778540 RepID=A0A2K8QNB9_9GAMM|nr:MULTISPECIES: flagellar basal body-associated protein FliL [Dickeya]ATZ95019.1 flagellar basal body-associated protein FliL [Dickeya fangzhongdai]AYH48721.1 flagellar basal body-associated protein FliL [Dickeya fangzhongdai]MBO8132282.1 flagellar basal body-associated protein FliL [Dickeya fangzhongdai]QOH48461.1 flagellar basal body-associated protein FliL [Dickeya fangzhongdai]QOH52764.1 flagellar basal body-associated protein FliL [Dickeya fangzhongdai]
MATSNKKAQSGGNKRSLWLILLIVIALAATAAAGAGWWLLSQKKAETAASEPPPPPAPVFMPLDTFTVNLLSPDNNPDRVLYVGITLRLPDEATRARLTNYLPEIRSRLIMLFSRQSSSVLATEQGKQKLVEDIKQVLSPPLVPGQPNQVVSDVLFTAFILR